MKTCPIHHTPLTCAACTGAQGGQATSPAKRAAAQANAKQPRPRKGQCPECGARAQANDPHHPGCSRSDAAIT